MKFLNFKATNYTSIDQIYTYAIQCNEWEKEDFKYLEDLLKRMSLKLLVKSNDIYELQYFWDCLNRDFVTHFPDDIRERDSSCFIRFEMLADLIELKILNLKK